MKKEEESGEEEVKGFTYVGTFRAQWCLPTRRIEHRERAGVGLQATDL